MHPITPARIHSSSLPPAAPSAPLEFCGGWKATLRPFCKGSCFASASFLAFGSLENGTNTEGPTEFRAGRLSVTLRTVGVGAWVAGAEDAGECGRGRLFRFSSDEGQSKIYPSGVTLSPGCGAGSGALRSAMSTSSCSIALSIALVVA